MNSLGNTLNGMLTIANGKASLTNSEQHQPNGLMQMDGSTITKPPAVVRENPLTKEQITVIQSSLQPLLPVRAIEYKQKTRFGEDEFGTYPITELVPTPTINIGQGSAIPVDGVVGLLKAALVVGTRKSVHTAITRLAMHKHLASNQQQAALLLHDYTDELAKFPEFVVLAVVDFHRLDNEGKFFPTLAEMRHQCQELQHAIERELCRITSPEHTIEKPKLRPAPKEKIDPAESQRINDEWEKGLERLGTLGFKLADVPRGISIQEFCDLAEKSKAAQ